jgi:hypothetical protein
LCCRDSFNFDVDACQVAFDVLEGTIGWKKPTPPHPPPYKFLRNLDVLGHSTDSGGGPLVAYNQSLTTASDICYQMHIAIDRMEGRHQDDQFLQVAIDAGKPIRVWNLLRDVRNGLECPDVEDARRQYLRIDFPPKEEGARGDLKRLLRITSSSHQKVRVPGFDSTKRAGLTEFICNRGKESEYR